jgi:hypothetical protein
MMPTEPLRDIMRRTMANLEFIERKAKPSGPFEVTQLVNSFLGALAHPWERLRAELNEMPLGSAGWPTIRKECDSDDDPKSLGDLVRHLRNAVAHGNVEFLPGPQGDIKALRIWNSYRGQRTWGAIITVAETRDFLVRFVVMAEALHERQGAFRSRIA